MAEHPLALYFPSPVTLMEGVTSLPRQLGSTADLNATHIHFLAIRNRKPILPSVIAHYGFNPNAGKFQVTSVDTENLARRLNTPEATEQIAKLSQVLLSGGRPAEVWVALEHDHSNFWKGGKAGNRRFARLFLSELTARGYVTDYAELHGLNGPTWVIDRVDMQLLGAKPPFQRPAFSMDVSERVSSRWLSRVFEEAKEHPFYSREYQLQMTGD